MSSSSEEEEATFEEESSSDDEPIAHLKQSGGDRRRSSSQGVRYRELEDDDDDDDDESDDDIPLAALAKKNGNKKASPVKQKAKPKAKATPPPKKKVKKAPPKSSASTTSVSSSKYEWASAALYGTESDKGLLIQRLLCRWWYAYAWPDPASIPAKPHNYDVLDGFPGVFVCTHGDKVGDILDTRDHTRCPSFANFAKKPAAELQDLLLKAIDEQKKQLVAAEGTGTATEKELDAMYKWALKIKPEKADKDALKVLQAAGLKL